MLTGQFSSTGWWSVGQWFQGEELFFGVHIGQLANFPLLGGGQLGNGFKVKSFFYRLTSKTEKFYKEYVML